MYSESIVSVHLQQVKSCCVNMDLPLRMSACAQLPYFAVRDVPYEFSFRPNSLLIPCYGFCHKSNRITDILVPQGL